MRVRLFRLLFLFFLFFASLSCAEAQVGIIGLLDGNQYLRLTDNAQTFYLAGLLDGMAMAPNFGAPMSGMDKLYDLGRRGITGDQFLAICKNALEARPEERREPMCSLAYQAIARAFHWPK